MPRRTESPFTPRERDLIRLELMPRFGQSPELANGLFLRTWRGAAEGSDEDLEGDPERARLGAGEDRHDPMGRPAALLTEAGLEGLRLLLQDRRAMDLALPRASG